MANNQITPFQLTDQFTMDNFNQRINETNTALQNNDPRKWGIGTNAVIPSGRSANNITADGFYYCDVDTPTGSDWLVYHAQRDDNWAVQLAVCSNAVEYGLVIRKKMSGVWKPWEWDNPPMELGEEYRTTERYRGKPVYVKAFNTGALGQNVIDDVFVDTPNADNIWVASGTFINTSGGGATPTSIPYYASADDNIVLASAYSGVIHRVYKGSAYTITNMIVVLKYTKSTD